MMLVGIIMIGLAIYLLYMHYEKSCTCDGEKQDRFCLYCGHEVQEEFLYCPNCREMLKKKCEGCGKLINISWRYCPYCNFTHKKE
ncbi:MAG: zinc ribbon domain-containing protein [Bacillota bacterium]